MLSDTFNKRTLVLINFAPAAAFVSGIWKRKAGMAKLKWPTLSHVYKFALLMHSRHCDIMSSHLKPTLQPFDVQV